MYKSSPWQACWKLWYTRNFVINPPILLTYAAGQIHHKRVIIQNKYKENRVGILHETGSKEVIIVCHGYRSCNIGHLWFVICILWHGKQEVQPVYTFTKRWFCNFMSLLNRTGFLWWILLLLLQIKELVPFALTLLAVGNLVC